MTNRIGWCDMTWNPVWGCLNKCEYCYARGVAKRFWKQRYQEEIDYQYKLHSGWAWTGNDLSGLDVFKPTWLESKFQKKLPKKPQRIFVGSMSEIYYWKDEWLEKVLEKTKLYPQHIFQFLTKFPDIYLRYDFPNNCWLGITVTTNMALYETDFITNIANTKRIKFISVEPILNRIEPKYIPKNINWIILGAETGNRKGKVIPKREWVLDIVRYCVLNKIPYYIKDNLSKYYGGYRGYKQFPKERRSL